MKTISSKSGEADKSDKSIAGLQPSTMQFYYMNSTKGEAWQSASETELEGVRQMESPRFITWTSTDFKEGSPYTPNYAAQFLPIDIDFKNDIEAAIMSVKALLEKLGHDARYAKVFCTGGKGFHVLLPAALFSKDGLQGTCLPGAAKRIVLELDIEGADPSLYCYGRGHMLREPNLKRDDGKYKVQISLEELNNLQAESYAEIVRSPRPLLTGPYVHQPSDQLAALYTKCLEAETAAQSKMKAMRAKAGIKGCTDLEELRLGLALDFLATEHGADYESYPEWKRVLLPLHLAGCEDLALAFSRMVPNFSERAFYQQWQAISDEVTTPLAIGSIFYEANAKGWNEFGVWDELQPLIESRLNEAETNPALLHETNSSSSYPI